MKPPTTKQVWARVSEHRLSLEDQVDTIFCFTNISRALQIILSKFVFCRNRISYEHFKLKLCTCSQSMALGTRTKFRLEILTIHVIFGIVYFREIILENSRNVSETTPRSRNRNNHTDNYVNTMGLLPDTWNCGLCMRRECREPFPRHRLQWKPLISDPGMHHGTCVTHVPWCMSGSLTRGGGENVPGIPGACTTRNFAYLVRGPWLLMLWHLAYMQPGHEHPSYWICRISESLSFTGIVSNYLQHISVVKS